MPSTDTVLAPREDVAAFVSDVAAFATTKDELAPYLALQKKWETITRDACALAATIDDDDVAAVASLIPMPDALADVLHDGGELPDREALQSRSLAMAKLAAAADAMDFVEIMPESDALAIGDAQDVWKTASTTVLGRRKGTAGSAVPLAQDTTLRVGGERVTRGGEGTAFNSFRYRAGQYDAELKDVANDWHAAGQPIPHTVGDVTFD